MGDPLPPDPKIAELLEQLNDLIEQAHHLREHIDRAARERLRPPVWPERRDVVRRFQDHRDHDRRRGGHAKTHK